MFRKVQWRYFYLWSSLGEIEHHTLRLDTEQCCLIRFSKSYRRLLLSYSSFRPSFPPTTEVIISALFLYLTAHLVTQPITYTERNKERNIYTDPLKAMIANLPTLYQERVLVITSNLLFHCKNIAVYAPFLLH